MLTIGEQEPQQNGWGVSPRYWIQQSCQRVDCNLTLAEWERYFPNETYRKTYEQLQLESEVTATP